MTNFICTQKPPPLYPFPPTSVPHTPGLASKSREKQQKKRRERWENSQKLWKKCVAGVGNFIFYLGLCHLCV